MKPIPIFIGYDPREAVAYHTCANSIIRHASQPVQIIPLALNLLQDYNGTINLLNGSVYSAEKIDEEIKAYTGEYERTLRPLHLSRKPPLELTVKKGHLKKIPASMRRGGVAGIGGDRVSAREPPKRPTSRLRMHSSARCHPILSARRANRLSGP